MSVNQANSTMKVRKSLSLSQETLRKGKQIAVAECRTFSNLIDALVDREFNRQFPEGKEQPPTGEHNKAA